MRHEAHIAPLADRLSAAFEHSITWEDDIWRADPVDVELVHANARRRFSELLDAVTATDGASVQARILLFHGQSGAGKTHLIRALRTGAHRGGKAYISRVWRTVREKRPEWGLSEIEFKCMLAEAHRSGQLNLANADLKDESNIKDVQDSAVIYRNAVFHFIRVDA